MEIIDSPEKVLEDISKLIDSSPVQFNYKILDNSNIIEMIDFINLYYFEKNDKFTLEITSELLNFYIIDAVALFFYGKNNPNKPIALIIGRRVEIMSFNNKNGAIEVNFFCIIPQLRKLNLPKLLKAYLIKECIKKYNFDIKFSYYTTSDKINVEPICSKNYLHRYINFDELARLGEISKLKNTPIFKKLYSKFNFPDNFKQYKINQNIEKNQIEEITNKINLYQRDHFSIYEYISNNTIKYINESNAFYKFVIYNNIYNNIEAVLIFYRLDTINVQLNEPIRTLRLYHYFAEGNIVDYLEYVADYMKNNNICDMLLIHLFEKNVPNKYIIGTGKLYYNLWNVKPFNIEEQKVQLVMI